jgi:hypothetical protein
MVSLPRSEETGLSPLPSVGFVVALQYNLVSNSGAFSMYHEPPGWLTFRVPTIPDKGMDSEYCFYNRTSPDSPIATVCVFLDNTDLLRDIFCVATTVPFSISVYNHCSLLLLRWQGRMYSI